MWKNTIPHIGCVSQYARVNRMGSLDFYLCANTRKNTTFWLSTHTFKYSHSGDDKDIPTRAKCGSACKIMAAGNR